mgnify:CR=1 FL=1|tara:strand:+ start:908 stop:1516 length:609 start_codon:yes stop_codon:yes gene_type:complete
MAFWRALGLWALVSVMLAACSGVEYAPTEGGPVETPDYIIGAGDNLTIFVWRNGDLTTGVPVRPDGRISTPLIEDMQAAGKTPTQLARDLEEELRRYVQDPIVTVIMTGFVGPFNQQVRVVGEAQQPVAIPYRERMSILDVMISVGGLTDFAAGNRAVLVRSMDGEPHSLRVRLDDLIKDGDVSANVGVLPGDILIIPQSYF